MRRLVASILVVVTLTACGPEFTSTGVLVSSERISCGEKTDEDEKTGWIIISAILVLTTLAGVFSLFVDDEMSAYLREHQRDVRTALAGGQGPFSSDLADDLGLPLSEVPRIRRLLR